jgi:two-component system, response regulator, stage 0 sporulation protein F
MSNHATGEFFLPSLTRGLRHELWRADHPRVFLAESNSQVRLDVAGRLRRDGCLVRELPEGRELLAAVSLELARARRGGRLIDLIISEATLPGMSGLEVLAAVRRCNWPVPFILLATPGVPGLRRQARRLGASATFEKPFELDDLMTAIALLVSQ